MVTETDTKAQTQSQKLTITIYSSIRLIYGFNSQAFFNEPQFQLT